MICKQPKQLRCTRHPLVRGTSGTAMEPLEEAKTMAEQTFKVSSTAADCILSEPQASAVDCGAPGPASAAGSADNARPTATSEHATKLPKDEVAALTTPEQYSKDPGSGHWSEERQRKVRRLVSEPDP